MNKKRPWFSKFFHRIKLEDITLFSRQLSTLLASGISLGRTFEILINQTENPEFKESVKDIYVQIHRGSALSRALCKHHDIFSPLYTAMIKCGEESGYLPSIMDKLAEAQEKDLRMIKRFKAALTYPFITLVFSIIVLFVLMKYIFPAFMPVFTSLNVKLPVITRILMSFSNFFSVPLYFIIFILLMCGTVYALFIYIKTPEGRQFKDKVLIKIPIVNVILPKMAISRFCRVFSLLYISGYPILATFEVVKNIIDNKVYEKDFVLAMDRMRQGDSISEALKDVSLFPASVTSMISVAETSGRLSKILNHVSDYYELEVEATLDKLNALFEPILILFLGGIVGVILISIILPLYNVIESIGP